MVYTYQKKTGGLVSHRGDEKNFAGTSERKHDLGGKKEQTCGEKGSRALTKSLIA